MNNVEINLHVPAILVVLMKRGSIHTYDDRNAVVLKCMHSLSWYIHWLWGSGWLHHPRELGKGRSWVKRAWSPKALCSLVVTRQLSHRIRLNLNLHSGQRWWCGLVTWRDEWRVNETTATVGSGPRIPEGHVAWYHTGSATAHRGTLTHMGLLGWRNFVYNSYLKHSGISSVTSNNSLMRW